MTHTHTHTHTYQSRKKPRIAYTHITSDFRHKPLATSNNNYKTVVFFALLTQAGKQQVLTVQVRLSINANKLYTFNYTSTGIHPNAQNDQMAGVTVSDFEQFGNAILTLHRELQSGPKSKLLPNIKNLIKSY